MAKASFKMPEDFLSKVSALEDKTDEIIPRVLEVGGEIALDKVRNNLSGVIGKGTKTESRSTGQLVNALGLSPARMDREGNYNVKVGFSEPRRDGVSNAKIANIIEYGKHGQPPKPFLKPAKTASRSHAIEAMKKKLDDELNNL
jgi:HK97 gp10 family phage protein